MPTTTTGAAQRINDRVCAVRAIFVVGVGGEAEMRPRSGAPDTVTARYGSSRSLYPMFLTVTIAWASIGIFSRRCRT
jgi:hypothetical protein